MRFPPSLRRIERERIKQGLCFSCGARPLKTSRRCGSCAQKSVQHSLKSSRLHAVRITAYRLARRDHFNRRGMSIKRRLVRQGFCSQSCGRRLVTKWYCRPCAELNSMRSSQWTKRNRVQVTQRQWEYRHGGFAKSILQRDGHQCLWQA